MRPSLRRTSLLLTGAASFALLISASRPAAAQELGGMATLGPTDPPFLRGQAVVGGQGVAGGQAGVVARGFPNIRPGGVSGFGGISGGASAPSFPSNIYGGYPTQYGGALGGRGYYGGYPYGSGYGGVVRNYQVPGQFFGGNMRPQLGGITTGEGRPSDVLPDSRSNPPTAHPSRPFPTLGGTATIGAPPTAPVISGGTNGSASSGSGVGTYYPPAFYGPTTFFTEGPALLGGYYYGDYCDSPDDGGTYPSVYGVYDGFPGYIESAAPGVTFLGQFVPPVYVDEPQPFYPPVYTVTYNQNNYYVTNQGTASDIAQGGEAAQTAVKKAYPADSYQAAFADIERSWENGDVSLLKKHLRSDDTKVSVSLKGAYKYSLNSSDFAQITRDAFDRLDTTAFKFTALQRAKNGDVTAYGTHTYQPEGSASDGRIVPFDADNADAASADDGDAAAAAAKTVYVSYTLRHGDDGWYVTAIDSSTEPLVKTAQ